MRQRYPLTNRVREWREQRGLSQRSLAQRVSASRQTVNAIEAGRTAPATALALRLAGALSCRVEDLFQVPGADAEMTADLVGGTGDVPAGTRVQVSTIRDRSVAVPLVGPLAATAALPEADGIVSGRRGSAVRVTLTGSGAGAEESLVIAGCDPTIPIVAGHLRRAHPAFGLRWLAVGSLRALGLVRDGAAHVAGMHLRSVGTGSAAPPAVHRTLRGCEAAVVRFVTWDQGLIVVPRNPKGIHGVADLARRGVSIVNRERGSGARALLDAELARCGLAAAHVRGYDREASTHLAVAQAVALGFVDAGVGIRAAARAHGLGFVPLQREHYDLVIPRVLLACPPVEAFLEVVQRHAVRRDLEAAGAYDTSELGASLPSMS